jgi:hypothetical protein
MLSFKALGLALARPFGGSAQSPLCLYLSALIVMVLFLLSAILAVWAEPLAGKLDSAHDGNPRITLVSNAMVICSLSGLLYSNYWFNEWFAYAKESC